MKAELGRKEQRLLNYLEEFGGITSIDAIRNLGDTRLSATIFNLRKKGFDIWDIRKEMQNRYGETVNFKYYYLKEAHPTVKAEKKSPPKKSKIVQA